MTGKITEDDDKVLDGTEKFAAAIPGDPNNYGILATSIKAFVCSGQIPFPSTQVPSSDPNTLDDYEEGTWTPSITFGGGNTGVTYAAGNTGTYVKVGKFVFCTGSLRLSNKGSSTGIPLIGGIPVPSDGGKAGLNLSFYLNLSGLTGVPILGLNEGTAEKISIYQSGAASSGNTSDTNFTNSSRFDFSFAYIAAN